MIFVWVKTSNFFLRYHVENSAVESDWHVFLVRTEGNLLLLLTREHCLVKKSLKSSVFSVKSMINLPLCNRGGIQGISIISKGL